MPSRNRRSHKPKGSPATTDEPPAKNDGQKPSTKPRKKPPLTHFLCIPLVNDASRPVLKASLRRFREEASSLVRAKAEDAEAEDGDRSAKVDADRLLEVLEQDERAVRPVGTLHLTLGVMSLAEEQAESTDAGKQEEISESNHDLGSKPKTLADARRLLESLDVISLMAGPSSAAQGPDETEGTAALAAPPSSPPPLSVTLKGLRSMHAPAKTSFLYTSPTDATDRLQPFCQRLKDAFVEKGLMLDEKKKGKLKLHATVLNTIYARPGDRKGKASDVVPKDALRETSPRQPTPQNEDPQHDDSKTNGDAVDGQEPHPEQEPAKRKLKRNRGPLRIDSRPLLEHFADSGWMSDLQLDRIAICKMGAAKVKNENGDVIDEAYEEVAVRKLPTL